MKAGSKEAALKGRDYAWLAGAVIAGGGVAPVLLLWGLSGTGASEASLLLNLEGVVTMLIAALLFREAVGRRVWVAAALMLAGGLVLSSQPQAGLKLSLHALAIVGACLCWALDNNLTRKISASDPVVLAMVKGLAAGSFNLALAYALGMEFPASADARCRARAGISELRRQPRAVHPGAAASRSRAHRRAFQHRAVHRRRDRDLRLGRAVYRLVRHRPDTDDRPRPGWY